MRERWVVDLRECACGNAARAERKGRRMKQSVTTPQRVWPPCVVVVHLTPLNRRVYHYFKSSRSRFNLLMHYVAQHYLVHVELGLGQRASTTHTHTLKSSYIPRGSIH